MVHPFFLNDKSEKLLNDFCLDKTGIDDSILNPAANADLLARLGCGKVLVCTAENDIMRTRGWSYYEALKKSEWKGDVEIVETMGMGHVFHLFNPNCEQARSLIKWLASFIKDDKINSVL